MSDSLCDQYRNRIRIFFELFYFSESWKDANRPNRKKRLVSEVLLQKLDFLVRNPDYLCLLLIMKINDYPNEKEEIKSAISDIFLNKEPELYRDEMVRFLYGAYEELDDTIAYLMGFDLIEYEVIKRETTGEAALKIYYITQKGVKLMEQKLDDQSPLQWYAQRCQFIKRYFGSFTGTQLKELEYTIDEYRNARLRAPIQDVIEKVRDSYEKEFNEQL